MNTFIIDSSETLGLARDLDAQAQRDAVTLPALPGGPLTDFSAAVAAAHENIMNRDDCLRDDLSYLAGLARAVTHAATAVDTQFAHALNQPDFTPPTAGANSLALSSGGTA